MAIELRLTVRYAETDMMGIVHHSRYFPWFEAARTEFIKQTGVSYSQMEKSGVLLPLAEAGAKYKKGLLYEDTAIVEARLTDVRAARCKFEYAVYRENENGERELCTLGYTLHGFTDAEFKPINLKKKDAELFEKLCALVEESADK